MSILILFIAAWMFTSCIVHVRRLLWWHRVVLWSHHALPVESVERANVRHDARKAAFVHSVAALALFGAGVFDVLLVISRSL